MSRRGTHYRRDIGAIADRINARVRETCAREARERVARETGGTMSYLTDPGLDCPTCGGRGGHQPMGDGSECPVEVREDAAREVQFMGCDEGFDPADYPKPRQEATCDGCGTPLDAERDGTVHTCRRWPACVGGAE